LNHRFVKFLAIGLVSTLIHFLVLTVLFKIFEWPIVLATVLAFFTSLIFSYLLNRGFTFASKIQHHIGLPKYLLVTGLGLFWNIVIMYTFVQVLDLSYLFSFLFMSCVVAVNNYFFNKTWVFVDCP